MCKNSVTLEFTSTNGSRYSKDFGKPPELYKWCPKCDKDDTNWIIFLKHICITLFDENYDLVYQIFDMITDREHYITNLPEDRLELQERINILIRDSAFLKSMLAKKLILESSETIYWQEIKIIAPFLNSHVKKNLKNRIKYIKNITHIREYLNIKYNIENIIVKKHDITISLLKRNVHSPESCLENSLESCLENSKECQICFEDVCVDKLICTNCKHPQICYECEIKIKEEFGRCAFCNIEY
jgi:hypothetical protein